ncbi:MAG: hypothetical protein BRD55_05460 [Bacteroidetes bacterium SW_9_63_38]|nr:MAG: hypothetical protein BRD55_05460 [Bacteroidetes bacterium SW_9_63_38]
MHFTIQRRCAQSRRLQAAWTLFTGAVLIGLMLLGAGCSLFGSNGGGDTTAPTAPNNLEGTSGNSQIELDWSEADGAETYNVYRSIESTGGAEGSPLKSGIGGASYTDESAENRTTYYYRITSVSPEGEESGASNEIEQTPFSSPPENRP